MAFGQDYIHHAPLHTSLHRELSETVLSADVPKAFCRLSQFHFTVDYYFLGIELLDS
jgi:hypothetical protein